MEITTRDGDAPGGYIPPWLSGLSSCSSIVVIKGSCVYAIVWCLVRAVAVGGAWGSSNESAMRAHWLTVTLFGKDRNLYMVCVLCSPGGLHLRPRQ